MDRVAAIVRKIKRRRRRRRERSRKRPKRKRRRVRVGGTREERVLRMSSLRAFFNRWD